MSESLGVTVLRKVAEHLENNPGSWCQGIGDLHQVMRQDSSAIVSALQTPGTQGCLYTLIGCFAGTLCEEPARQIAIDEAVRTLCRKYGMSDSPGSVMKLNDDVCTAPSMAARLVRRALAKQREHVRA